MHATAGKRRTPSLSAVFLYFFAQIRPRSTRPNQMSQIPSTGTGPALRAACIPLTQKASPDY
jgi:hypothetical protein